MGVEDHERAFYEPNAHGFPRRAASAVSRFSNADVEGGLDSVLTRMRAVLRAPFD